jgi:hypothetical protein
MQLADFPRWLRGMFAIFLILFFFNAIYALAFLTGLLATWSGHIDQGVATLIGAILGLGIIAWQTQRGFANLIRSQEHQHRLEIEREQRRSDEEKRILMAALRAEIVGLMQQADHAMRNSRMLQSFHEALSKGKARAVVKSFVGPTFEGPVYRANVSKIGLLGASLGGDVVEVMTMTGIKPHVTFDAPMDHGMIATLHEGLADRLEEWHGELYHVAMRLLAIEGGRPDPGTLLEKQTKRQAILA